jgi:hypothetical protein
MKPGHRLARWVAPVVGAVALMVLSGLAVFSVRAHLRTEAAWRRAVVEDRRWSRGESPDAVRAALDRREREAAARVAAARARLQVPDDGRETPQDGAALLVALAGLWDECRGQAAWSDVPFPRGDGLSAFGVSPGESAPERIVALWATAGGVAHVVGQLIEAGPTAVTAVRPLPEALPDSGWTAARVRLAGVAGLEGRAYRVEFTGATAVLRDFLNRLVQSDWPVFVRSVEFLPETAESSRDQTRRPRPVFRVVVECVQWREPLVVAAR